jgi:membrane dipeptidase
MPLNCLASRLPSSSPSVFRSQSQTHSSAATDPYLAAERILEQTPLIDGHNDLPWRIREDSIARGNVAAYDLRKRTPGHTDLDRLKKGMVGAQFWSVYTPGEWRDSGYARIQLEQIDIARRMIAKYPTVSHSRSAQTTSTRIRTVSLPPPRAPGRTRHRKFARRTRAYYDLSVRYMT